MLNTKIRHDEIPRSTSATRYGYGSYIPQEFTTYVPFTRALGGGSYNSQGHIRPHPICGYGNGWGDACGSGKLAGWSYG